MMKYVVLLALTLFTSLSGWAFSLDNADIRLLCPQRGQIKVLLHRYQHTQQSWEITISKPAADTCARGRCW